MWPFSSLTLPLIGESDSHSHCNVIVIFLEFLRYDAPPFGSELGLSSIVLIFHVVRLKLYVCWRFYSGRRPTSKGIFLCLNTYSQGSCKGILRYTKVLPVACVPLSSAEKLLSCQEWSKMRSASPWSW